MRRLLFVLPLLAAATALLLPKMWARPPQVIRTADGARMSFPAMIADVAEKSVVFVGESHDVPHHHRIELRIVRALHERSVPVVIALEMFPLAEQRALDRWIDGTLPPPDFISAFRKNWGDWRQYREIFLYARENRIPMIGINIPREIVRKVAEKGFGSLGGEEKEALPPGVTCSFGRDYMDFVRRVYREHSLSGNEFEYFCEAQMLWNKGMAWNLGRYLGQKPRSTVVVLTGTAHAVKEGIPAHLPTAPGRGTAVILPDCPQAADRRQVAKETDYLVLR